MKHLSDEKVSHLQLREVGEGHALLQGCCITFLDFSKTCVVQGYFVMTWCDTQHVVFDQILIPLCVREIRDVKHLYTIVVVTEHPHGWMCFEQTTEGLVQ